MSDTQPLHPLMVDLRRGLLGRCPCCGKGRTFRAFLKVSDRCDVCGEELFHHRADDFPAYVAFHRFESVHAHAPLQNDDDAFDRLKEAHRQAESERQPQRQMHPVRRCKTGLDKEEKSIRGGGVESCGSWLQHRSRGGSSDMQWALGYLSGVAVSSIFDPLAKTDGDGVWYWLDNYCSTHPERPLADGLDTFVIMQSSHGPSR